MEQNRSRWSDNVPVRLPEPLTGLFASRSHVRVLRALGALPDGVDVSAREIGRRAGIAHTTAARVLSELADEGIVLVRLSPAVRYYQLNRDHLLAGPIVDLLTKERQVQSLIADRVRSALKRHRVPVAEAYIFGSAARGELTSASDIDVAIVVRAKGPDQLEAALSRASDDVRRELGNPVQFLIDTSPVGSPKRDGRAGAWREVAERGIKILPE